MTSSNFTLELAISLYESEDKFPVDMWEAGEWLGYSRKDSAKRFFLSCGFIKDKDYQIHRNVEMDAQSGIPHYKDNYSLSVECFKFWGMMAKNEQGRKIREYFLECEEIAKKKKAEELKFIQSHARVYKPEFSKEFYDELYRVTGYVRSKKGQNPYTAIIIREYVYGMFGQEVLDEIDRVNPIIGYAVYEVPKATPQEIASLKHKIHGYKAAITWYTRSGKTSKVNQTRKKVEKLTAKLQRIQKPHSIRLPKRAHTHHQFCSDLIGLPSLQAHLQTMVTVMRTLPCNDADRFYEAMTAAFPNGALKNVSSVILDLPALPE